MAICSCLSINVRNFKSIMLILSISRDKHCNYNVLILITKSFPILVFIPNAMWMVLFLILILIQPLGVKKTSFFPLSRKINLISKVYITWFLLLPPSFLIYNNNWLFVAIYIMPLFLIIWSKIPSTTRRYSLLRDKIL